MWNSKSLIRATLWLVGLSFVYFFITVLFLNPFFLLQDPISVIQESMADTSIWTSIIIKIEIMFLGLEFVGCLIVSFVTLFFYWIARNRKFLFG